MNPHEFNFNGHQYVIPERMRDSIKRYVENGVEPGGFLQAVIMNNLADAYSRADDENFVNLPAYVNFFYNHAPSFCWGDRDRMNAWIEKGGIKNGRSN